MKCVKISSPPKCLDGTMAKYLGKLNALFHDFNELLLPPSTPSQELEQRSKFFMLLGLLAFLIIIVMFLIRFWGEQMYKK